MKTKKTVKELNDTIERLEKKLDDLNKVVVVLTGAVKELEGKGSEEVLNPSPGFQSFNCKSCSKIFPDKNMLRVHITESHPKLFKCQHCEKTFDVRFKLENHLEEHEIQKLFKCQRCESNFFLKWRLEKHVRMHDDANVKCCHFYNNGKVCPYKKIGCQFKHEKAGTCPFIQDCRNKMCQYEHENVEQLDNVFKTQAQEVLESGNESLNMVVDDSNEDKEEIDSSLEIDEICDKVLEHEREEFIGEENDILSDSFLDNIMEKMNDKYDEL